MTTPTKKNHDQTDQMVKKYWTDKADMWDGLYESESPFWRWFNRVFRKGIFLRAEESVKAAMRTSAESLLDVGSGSGRVSCLLAEAGVQRVQGVDVAPTMVELAKQLAKERGVEEACDFEVGNFMEHEFDEKFDGVIALGVFDYLPETVPFLKKMRSLANKFVVVSLPKPTLVRSPLRKIRYTLRKCPIFFYTRSRIDKLFQEAGFTNYEINRATGAGYIAIGWIEETE